MDNNYFTPRKQLNKLKPVKWLIPLLLLFALNSCGQEPEAQLMPSFAVSPTPNTASPTPTVTITPSATPIPQGTEGNPVVLGIVYSDTQKQVPATEEFIQFLADRTGYVFAIQPYPSNLDLLTAMDKGLVSFSWLQPEEYLYAAENDIAQIAFLARHYGLYGYGSTVYIKSDSDFKVYYNPNTGASTVDASAALHQFSQKTPCLVNQRSLSGYAYPTGMLTMLNIPYKEPVLMQSHESVIRAIYSGGICDFGITYGISGDPRTASALQKDLPEVMDKVEIAWQSPAEIPSLNLSYATLLSGDIRFAITTALSNFAETQEGLQTLSQMNNYAIDGLRPASDDEYENLRSVLRAGNIDLQNLISQ